MAHRGRGGRARLAADALRLVHLAGCAPSLSPLLEGSQPEPSPRGVRGRLSVAGGARAAV